MFRELLQISVLNGAQGPESPVMEILETLPQVQVSGSLRTPEELLATSPGAAPDLVLVDLQDYQDLPAWLKDLTSHLPQTAVVVCSARREPEFLILSMQAGIREFLPLPLERADLEAALARVRTAKKRQASSSAPQGKVVVVTGHKGGAGATSVAVNLAVALGELQPERVVLMDLGRPFPDVGNFLDRDNNYTILDLVQNLGNMDQGFLQKIIQPVEPNLAILHGISDFKEQDAIDLESLEKIFATLRSLYPWIVVDLSHWLDELFLRVLGAADLVLMLTELTVPDVRNLGNLWPLFREWQDIQGKVKVVVNRFVKGNGIGLKNVEHVTKEPVFYTLPNDYSGLVEAVNRGVPLATVAPRSKLAQSLQELAQHLVTQASGESSNNHHRSRRRFWIF